MGAARTGSLGALEVKGDLLAFDGEGLQRVPAGTVEDVLTPDPTGALGVAFKKALLPRGYTAKMDAAYVGPSQVAITPGACRSGDDTFDFRLLATLTADLTVAGVSGLDTGAEAASTWYALWVIGDSTGVNSIAALLSASFTAPVMPVGYDKRRRLGCVRNDAASNFIPFVAVWNGYVRRYYLDATPATTNVLAGGAAAVFTDVPLSAFVPPSSRHGILLAEFSAGLLGLPTDELLLRPDGFSASAVAAPITIRTGLAIATKVSQQIQCDCPNQIVEYRVSDAVNNSADLSVIGFDDEL